MKNRSITRIVILNAITLGLFFIYWCVESKKYVNSKAGKELVPTAWWFIIPMGAYWWAWQYAQAVEQISQNKIKYVETFGMFIVATMGGFAIFQFNPFDFESTSTSINWALFGPFIFISYFATVGFLSLFPIWMQKKFNPVSPPANKQAPPQPPAPTSSNDQMPPSPIS